MPETLESVRTRLAQGKPCRILGLGDSITYGWEVARGFFDRFCDSLSQRYHGSEIDRINAGIPGDTAEGGLERLDELIAGKPHLATVQFAINDCFAMVELADFTKSITAISNLLVSSNTAVVLCTSCSVAHLEEAQDLAPFYDAIEKVAQELNLPVASLHLYWQQHAGIKEDLFGWDGIHPTDKGHELMAQGLLEIVLGEEK